MAQGDRKLANYDDDDGDGDDDSDDDDDDDGDDDDDDDVWCGQLLQWVMRRRRRGRQSALWAADGWAAKALVQNHHIRQTVFT